MKSFTKLVNSGFLLGICLIGFLSCEPEPSASGCTDPLAENYNPDATIQSDNCNYAREKFLGNYLPSESDCTELVFDTLAIMTLDSIPNFIKVGLSIEGQIFYMKGKVNDHIASLPRQFLFEENGWEISLRMYATLDSSDLQGLLDIQSFDAFTGESEIEMCSFTASKLD